MQTEGQWEVIYLAVESGATGTVVGIESLQSVWTKEGPASKKRHRGRRDAIPGSHHGRRVETDRCTSVRCQQAFAERDEDPERRS